MIRERESGEPRLGRCGRSGKSSSFHPFRGILNATATVLVFTAFLILLTFLVWWIAGL